MHGSCTSSGRWALAAVAVAAIGVAAAGCGREGGGATGHGNTALLVSTVMGRASHAQGAVVRGGESLRSNDGKVLLAGPGGLNVELWRDSILVPLGGEADLPCAAPGRGDIAHLRLEKGTIQMMAVTGFEVKAGKHVLVGERAAGGTPVMVSVSLERREVWGGRGAVDLIGPDGSRRRLAKDERLTLE